MKKQLIRLANHLDKVGLYKEADYIDFILKKAEDIHKEFLKDANDKGYSFDDIDQVLEKGKKKAAIGTHKSSMVQAARQGSFIDALRKLDQDKAPKGYEVVLIKKYNKVTYTLVTIPK